MRQQAGGRVGGGVAVAQVPADGALVADLRVGQNPAIRATTGQPARTRADPVMSECRVSAPITSVPSA
jgi:hypothetical protein